jgi:hypothetical protein
MPNRTAILIHCSSVEAREIRRRADLEHRSVSSYMAHVLMSSVGYEEKLFTRLKTFDQLNEVSRVSRRPMRPRTTILLRCSLEESSRIRRAAKRRGMTISGFIVQALRHQWELSDTAVQRIRGRA